MAVLSTLIGPESALTKTFINANYMGIKYMVGCQVERRKSIVTLYLIYEARRGGRN